MVSLSQTSAIVIESRRARGFDETIRDGSQATAHLIEYSHVGDGVAYDQGTFQDHKWIIQNQFGVTLQEYVATGEEKQCVLITQP